MNNSIKTASFGYHPYASEYPYFLHKDSPIVNLSHKAQRYTIAIAAVLAATKYISIQTAAKAILAVSALYYGIRTCARRHICQTAGIIFNQDRISALNLTPKLHSCQALPTEHSADTELWREKLIERAEHNIILSGNYCGGASFIDFLDLVEKRIKERPSLSVLILSSPKMLSNVSCRRMNEMLTRYPHNVSLVTTPEILHISPGIKISTNHTKCLCIDFGTYFILGGSGVKDNFTQTGIDSITKEEFRAIHGKNIDINAQKQKDETLFIDRLLPAHFRDMDFVFHSPPSSNSLGTQIYKQLVLLAHRWEEYDRITSSTYRAGVSRLSKIDDFGLFTGSSNPIELSDSLTTKLLKTAPQDPSLIKTDVPAFDQSMKKADHVRAMIFASGPEQDKSPFSDLLLAEIQRAKKSIVIDHMYFHPTNEILNALKDAAIRGVQIQILTKGLHKNCPKVDYIGVASRNKYNYIQLAQSLNPIHRKNLKVFEFQGNQKSLHKKVIIFDEERVIAGSSNLGYKSLVYASDHELNFLAISKKFAEETLKIYKTDLDNSKEIQDLKTIHRKDLTLSYYHYLLSPIID